MTSRFAEGVGRGFLAAALVFGALGCGGKIAASENACSAALDSCNAPPRGDVLPEAGTQSDAGAHDCGPWEEPNGPACVAKAEAGLDAGEEAGVSSFDPTTACAGNDNVFVIAGDDNVHEGPALRIVGGSAWSVTTNSSLGGFPSFVTVSVQDNWFAVFSSEQLGMPLSPSSYLSAERAAFAEPGHPGLDVYGDGVGCNRVAGGFEVQSIEFSIQDAGAEPLITSFAATFEQHCEAGKRSNVGCVRFRL